MIRLCFYFLAFVTSVAPAMSQLLNPGFEEANPDGSPVGWRVHTRLDTNRYGPPEYEQTFDMIVPVRSHGGRAGSEYCVAFPQEGTWLGRVWEHKFGRSPDGRQVDGTQYGKAALSQTVTLPPGKYMFSVWLRTAAGAAWSGSFSIGWNRGEASPYANDDSTGIEWSRHDLGINTSPHGLGTLRDRGEWLEYRTKPFSVDESGDRRVTVWIRLNYVNNHDMPTRWEIDDANIIAYEPKAPRPPVPVRPSLGAPLEYPLPGHFVADSGDNEGGFLVADDGSTVRGDILYRLFQHARCVTGSASFEYAFPVSPKAEVTYLAFEHSGPCKVTIGGRVILTDEYAVQGILHSKEYVLTDRSLWMNGRLSIRFETAVADRELAVTWVEAGTTTRFRERLWHVERDTVSIPWRVGLWDFQSSEFRGEQAVCVVGETKPSSLNPKEFRIEWTQRLNPFSKYVLVLGYHKSPDSKDYAYGRIDVGSDNTVEMIGRTGGYEALDFDVTELLHEGSNSVLVSADAIDFVALLEVVPGATDKRRMRLYFEGDELADNITHVLHHSMFWMLNAHYDYTGFVDASVPHGKWWQQYWPIDIGFALRAMLHWGFYDQAESTARLVAKVLWEGHESNRSGGFDNTGGSILALEMCEIIRRQEFSKELVDEVWPSLNAYCDQICEEVENSPFGMVKGTNWENAGNLEQGPCYAISTNLLAMYVLQKAADMAVGANLPGDANRYRSTAERIRREVLARLVFPEDVTSPSGWIYPKGTWAYGLLDDGSYMLRPLAGYFWAGAHGTSLYGFIDPDSEIRTIYSATEDAALPLFGRNQTLVSGYAESYDGPEIMLSSAALSDKTGYMGKMIPHIAKQLDIEEDIGSPIAEISRWVVGPAGWCEDTNLVGVAAFLDWPRYILGIDDILYEDQQLRLIPRMPTEWTECGVNDWPVQYLRNGKRDTTKLTYNYVLKDRSARLSIRTEDPVRDMRLRLGPFMWGCSVTSATLNGRPVRWDAEKSGDGLWVWLTLDTATTPQTIVLTAVGQ